MNIRGRQRVTAVAALMTVAISGGFVQANGRPPASTTVHLQPGSSESIYLATTFGLLISHDSGCSFRWVCEQNIGYGGTFDPKYEVARDGTIYATTFNGLRISRDDGCSFETATEALAKNDPVRFAGRWVDAIDLGPNDEVWVATAETGAPNDVFRSLDAGNTFAAMGLQSPTIWWKSVVVAPSRAERVYVTGYEIAGDVMGGPGSLAHVMRSDDGGASWVETSLGGVALASTPVVTVAAVSPTDPDVLWLRSHGANPPAGDVVYRSTDAGDSWVEVLSLTDALRDLVIRLDGSVIAASATGGSAISGDQGGTFTPLIDPPRLSCLAETEEGNLLGCGQNWDPDFLSLGISSDADTWTKVFRFADMAGPVVCPEGTAQHDVCDVQQWPTMQQQYAPTPPSCGPDVDGAPPDAAGPSVDDAGGGCCNARAGNVGGSLALAAPIFLLWVWPRRRRLRSPVR